ncbi:MAG: DUF1353 domain-containing protein [Cyanobacteria bacterium P01_E01_bin.34]
MEKYQGCIDIEFQTMPSIDIKSIDGDNPLGVLGRLALATKKREFYLQKSWEIQLNSIKYAPELNGTVRVPVTDKEHKKIVFDGASIPLPWLVSLLTIGILRPLGVMLVGSIVHDYAFKYGHLILVDSNGQEKEVKVERQTADKLLRDILTTVNGLPPVGFVTYLAVRWGWLFVRYNNMRRGGAFPFLEYLILILLVAGIGAVISAKGIGFFLTCFAAIYLVLYILSLLILSALQSMSGKEPVETTA